jgi:hypothetical protein
VDSLSRTIGVYPAIVPPPFSALRQATQAKGSGQLAGPHADPDGWFTLPELTISGEIFGARAVDIIYQLSLAKPVRISTLLSLSRCSSRYSSKLCYTRGTHIPLWLAITSSDLQALDLLSAPTAPVVKLFALMNSRPKCEAEEAKGADLSSKQLYTDTRILQTARWLPTALDNALRDQSDSGNTRTLVGEIHLAENNCPGFKLEDLKLWVRCLYIYLAGNSILVYSAFKFSIL